MSVFSRVPALSRASAFLLAALAFGACDSNDEESVYGLWAAQGIDVIYWNIQPGRITVYDYLGDEFDEGPDCYEIYQLTIARREGADYTLESADAPGIQLTVTLERSGDRLTLSFAGESDTWILSGASIGDFSPTCSAPKSSKSYLPTS